MNGVLPAAIQVCFDSYFSITFIYTSWEPVFIRLADHVAASSTMRTQISRHFLYELSGN